MLSKQNDDILWFNRIGDVAFVDKIFITGPPRSNMKNPTAMWDFLRSETELMDFFGVI